jgi:hypothetical protein
VSVLRTHWPSDDPKDASCPGVCPNAGELRGSGELEPKLPPAQLVPCKMRFQKFKFVNASAGFTTPNLTPPVDMLSKFYHKFKQEFLRKKKIESAQEAINLIVNPPIATLSKLQYFYNKNNTKIRVFNFT